MPGWDPSKPTLAKTAAATCCTARRARCSRCPATGTERPMAFQGFDGPGDAEVPLPGGRILTARGGRSAAAPPARTLDYGRVVRIALRDQTAACSRRRPGAPRLGSAATTGAARWSGSTRASTIASAREPLHPRQGEDEGAMGLALCVMMALALGAVMAGRPERMRSPSGAAARLIAAPAMRIIPIWTPENRLGEVLRTSAGNAAAASAGRIGGARRGIRRGRAEKPLQRKCLESLDG